MTIPYIEERKKLLALHQQRDAIWEEREQALAPLEARTAAEWQEVLTEHEAAGGKWTGGMDDYRKIEALAASKHKPAMRAVEEARKPFEARLEAVHNEIKKIEATTGRISEDHRRGEGKAFCAVTGLPILESDEVGSVIIAALPAKA
jgi:hypothetical protein